MEDPFFHNAPRLCKIGMGHAGLQMISAIAIEPQACGPQQLVVIVPSDGVVGVQGVPAYPCNRNRYTHFCFCFLN